MAQYIALAASAMSILSEPKKNDKGITSEKTGLGFSSGVAMGFALGVIVLSQYKRRRIKERIKYNFAEWFSYQHETSDCVNNEIISIGEDAIMEVIASSNNTLSSNLNCSRIQMKKGTQIITETKGVEVYYIIHGSLQFSWKDSEKTTVEANGSIIVPPWTIRNISNNNNDDAVFLRISDTGDNANLSVEVIDRQNSFQSITNGIKASFQKIGEGFVNIGGVSRSNQSEN